MFLNVATTKNVNSLSGLHYISTGQWWSTDSIRYREPKEVSVKVKEKRQDMSCGRTQYAQRPRRLLM